MGQNPRNMDKNMDKTEKYGPKFEKYGHKFYQTRGGKFFCQNF
jgi:hypothetical protein